MSASFKNPTLQAIDLNGNVVPNASLYFYANGTTTEVAIYSDTGLSTALPNPLVANTQGFFANGSGIVSNVFWSGALLTLVLKDADGATVWTVNDYTSSTDVIGSLDQYAGANDTERLESAIAAGAAYVRLTRNFTLANKVTIPNEFTLDFAGRTITKGFNGDMFDIGTDAVLMNGKMNGDGSTYTGNGVNVPVGKNNQRFIDFEIVNCAGPCVDFKDDGAGATGGTNFAWIGGEFGCTTTTDPAISGPATELSTNGIRRFIGLHAGGHKIMELNAARVTSIIGCSAQGIDFHADSIYCYIDEGSRISNPSALTISGSGHVLRGDFSATSIVLAASTTRCEVRAQYAVTAITFGASATNNTIWAQNATAATVTDNSTNTTNRVIQNAVHVPRGASPWYITKMAAIGDTAWEVQHVGSSALKVGTAASGAHVLFESQNNVDLRFGVGTANDLMISTTDIKAGLDFLPSATESLDLGSTSLEWDNLYVQNAVTVSDERRKDDLGLIDGDQALSFIGALDAHWYSFKDTVIPAHTKEAIRKATRTETTMEPDPGNPEKYIPVEREVEYEEKYLVDVPEGVVSHGRPHAGLFAQQVKAAMTEAGIEDFAVYQYDKGEDRHFLRPLEMQGMFVAAINKLSERLDALEGGG